MVENSVFTFVIAILAGGLNDFSARQGESNEFVICGEHILDIWKARIFF